MLGLLTYVHAKEEDLGGAVGKSHTRTRFAVDLERIAWYLTENVIGLSSGHYPAAGGFSADTIMPLFGSAGLGSKHVRNASAED